MVAAPDIEYVKLVPGIITASVAVWGLYLAQAGLDKWRRETIGKRRAELAEDVLALAYEVREAIATARFPGGHSDEGGTREKSPHENPGDTAVMNGWFRTAERLNNKSDLFAQLRSRKYRFMAMFGNEHASKFDDLFRIIHEIRVAVTMLVTTYSRHEQIERHLKDQWEAKIGWSIEAAGDGKDDPVRNEVNTVIAALEGVCRPAIQEGSQTIRSEARSGWLRRVFVYGRPSKKSPK